MGSEPRVSNVMSGVVRRRRHRDADDDEPGYRQHDRDDGRGATTTGEGREPAVRSHVGNRTANAWTRKEGKPYV